MSLAGDITAAHLKRAQAACDHVYVNPSAAYLHPPVARCVHCGKVVRDMLPSPSAA